jgi:hypothetical protein
VVVAAPTGRRADPDAFWRTNEVIWTSAGMTLVAAGCIAAGLAIVIEMLEYLFDLHIPDGVMRDLCIVIFGLVAPLSWLAQIPPSFDDGLGGRTPASFISDAVSAIVRYVLVWLVIAYALILHAYAVKILFQFAMPKDGSRMTIAIIPITTGGSMKGETRMVRTRP